MVISEALGHRFKITLGLGFFFQDNKWHHVHREESEMTHPVDEDIFGQTRVWVLDTAESIHDFTSVQLLHHLLQTSIYTHTHTHRYVTQTCFPHTRSQISIGKYFNRFLLLCTALYLLYFMEEPWWKLIKLLLIYPDEKWGKYQGSRTMSMFLHQTF